MNINAAKWQDIGDAPLAIIKQDMWRVSSPMLDDIESTYAAAKPHTALFFAQAWLENQYETTGHIIKPKDHNPVSLRPERHGDLGPYGYGLIKASDGGQFLAFKSDADCAREWKRRLIDDAATYKGGVYAGKDTLAAMLSVYAPSGDVHPVTGLDNADIGYMASVLSTMERYQALAAKEAAPEKEAGMNIGKSKLRIAFGVGHANTSGGNPYELMKNRQVAAALIQLVEQSDGFELRCWTPNKGQGTFPGPLDVAAAQVRSWVNQGWQPHFVHELHHEGHANRSVRGPFAIYPDSWGLRGRKAGGDYTDIDVRNNAPAMAAVLSEHLNSPRRGNGAMSERSTGVGGQGFRLGFFGAVSDAYFRDNACVFITEALTFTNPADRATMDTPSFPRRQAQALLEMYALLAKNKGWTYPYKIGTGGGVPAPVGFRDGDRVEATDTLNVRQGYGTNYKVVHQMKPGDTAVIGKDGAGDFMVTADGHTWLNIDWGSGTGWAAMTWLKNVQESTKPEPVEPAPAPQPEDKPVLEIPALDKFSDTDPNVIPACVEFEWNGRKWDAFYVGDRWEAAKDTPRYGRPDMANTARTGKDILKGHVFDVSWIVVEQGKGNARIMGRTPWHTFVKMGDTNRVGDTTSR